MATPSTNGAVPSKSPVSNDSHDRQVPNIESDIQLRAFIGLQRLIVARYEQELELKNKLLLEGTKTEENCDIATLDEVHELVHKYCEAVDDLEAMLRRPPLPIKPRNGKNKEERSYRKILREKQGIELRLGNGGLSSRPRHREFFKALVGYLVTLLLTTIGFAVLIVPMNLILFIPGLSRAVVVIIVSVALLILLGTLQLYRLLILQLEAMSTLRITPWFLELHGWFEPMSGKEIVGIVGAYAAVLFVFLGAYLSPT